MPDPLIPATVIGSWSFPGWYEKFIPDVAEHPSEFGPVDREEALRDAIRLAIDDQVRAGLDRITDGEMQRVDFNLGFYAYLEGLEPFPKTRLLGPPAHDQRDQYAASRRSPRPTGLGSRQGIPPLPRALQRRPPRCPFPGRSPWPAASTAATSTPTARPLTEALIPIVNAELKAVVAAGVDFLQLDEPSFACHPDEPDYFLDVVARTVEGVDAYISMHMCFGNYRARAVGWRSYAPLFPHIGRAKVNQLALEFASREMAEVELARRSCPTRWTWRSGWST